MKEAPVLIFVMNDLAAVWITPSAGTNGYREFATPRPLTLPSKIGVLRLTALELGSLWICNTYFACPELCHTLKSRCEPICALALGYAAEAPLTDCAKLCGCGEILRFIVGQCQNRSDWMGLLAPLLKKDTSENNGGMMFRKKPRTTLSFQSHPPNTVAVRSTFRNFYVC